MQDKNKDPGATDKFKEISEAYDVRRFYLRLDTSQAFMSWLHPYSSMSRLSVNVFNCRSCLILRSGRSMTNSERKV